MKQAIIATISALALLASPSPAASGHSPKHVEVYITAKDTGQRLAKAGEVELVNSLPPVEKEDYITVVISET
jgi:hypothetical protein